MRAGQVSNLVRVPNRNVKAHFRGILDPHTGRTPAPPRWSSLHNRRRCPAPLPPLLFVHNVIGVPRARLLLLRPHRRPHHNLLLRRRGRRALLVARGAAAQGSKRVIDGGEARRLGDEAARGSRPAAGGGGLGRGLRGRLVGGLRGWRGGGGRVGPGGF